VKLCHIQLLIVRSDFFETHWLCCCGVVTGERKSICSI